MDWTTIITGILGIIAGGGATAWLTVGNERAKGKIDLARQLAEECADKTRKIRDLIDENIALIKANHAKEMELLSVRCDKQTCKWRHPPLPWMRGISMEVNANEEPEEDPEPLPISTINH